MASEGTKPALASYSFIYPPIPPTHPSIHPIIHPFIYPIIHPPIQPSIHSPTHTSNKHLACAPMRQAPECREMLRCTKQNVRKSQQRKSSGTEDFSKAPPGQCRWERGDPSSRSSSVTRRPGYALSVLSWLCSPPLSLEGWD